MQAAEKKFIVTLYINEITDIQMQSTMFKFYRN